MTKSEYIKLRDTAFSLVSAKSINEYRYFSPINKQPYWTHLMNVHNYLVTWGETSYEVLLAAILHDIVEDSDVTLDYIKKTFGNKVAELVNFCTKKTNQSEEEFYYTIINADCSDAARIKIFDRIDNILTNYAYSNMEQDIQKKKEKIMECKKYFIPLAQKAKVTKQFKNALNWWENNLTI